MYRLLQVLVLTGAVVALGVTGSLVYRRDRREHVGQTAAHGIAWLSDQAEATRVAAERGFPLFVDIWADWCAPCIEMDRTTFRDEVVVRKLTSGFVPLRVDVSSVRESSADFYARYGVSALPAVVLDGAHLSGGSISRMQGYQDAATLTGHLDVFNDAFRRRLQEIR